LGGVISLSALKGELHRLPNRADSIELGFVNGAQAPFWLDMILRVEFAVDARPLEAPRGTTQMRAI
jgi:hypothetical protein